MVNLQSLATQGFEGGASNTASRSFRPLLPTPTTGLLNSSFQAPPVSMGLSFLHPPVLSISIPTPQVGSSGTTPSSSGGSSVSMMELCSIASSKHGSDMEWSPVAEIAAFAQPAMAINQPLTENFGPAVGASFFLRAQHPGSKRPSRRISIDFFSHLLSRLNGLARARRNHRRVVWQNT